MSSSPGAPRCASATSRSWSTTPASSSCPGIRIPNLASHLLAQLQRRLPHDWERRYALRPVLLETFCESARFLGTCYQSANWLCVGYTQGRGKLDVHRQSALPVKSVWLKPLHKNWRQILCR